MTDILLKRTHDQVCLLEGLLFTAEGMHDLCKIIDDFSYRPTFLTQLGWNFTSVEMDEICPNAYSFNFDAGNNINVEVQIIENDSQPYPQVAGIYVTKEKENNEPQSQVE